MIRQDYILTLIEQLGALFQAILKREASPARTDQMIEDLAGQWIGLPPTTLFCLPAEEVHRLFVESDKMVGEKIYLMAELCRAKGLVEADEDMQRDLYRKALYFYRLCPAELDEKSRRAVDEHIAALGAILDEAPEAVRENQVHHHIVPAADDEPVKPKPPRSGMFFRVIALAVIASVVYLALFDSPPPYSLTDTVWEKQDATIAVSATLHNRTDEPRLIAVQFVADHSSGGGFEKALTFVGSAERQYEVPAQTALPIDTTFPLARNVGPGIAVTASIIRVAVVPETTEPPR